MTKANTFGLFPLPRRFLEEIENMFSVYLSTCENTRGNLGRLVKAVDFFPKLPLVFLFNN